MKQTRSSKLVYCLLTILDYRNIDRSSTCYYIHDVYVNDYTILTAQAQFWCCKAETCKRKKEKKSRNHV